MSGPITWRNVSGPSVAAATQPLALAGNTFNNAFEGLSKMLQQRQAVNQGVEDRAEADRLVTAQELLYGAKTPEEVAAATQQINALKEGLNAKSRTALLGAEDKRVNEVNDIFTKTLAAKNARTDADQAATVQQVKQLQAAGKVDEANALAATLRTGGDLALSGRVISREDAKTALDTRATEHRMGSDDARLALSQDQFAYQQKYNSDKLAIDRENSQVSNDYNRALTDKARREASATGGGAALDKAMKDALEEERKKGIYGAGTWGDEDGIKAVTTAATAAGFSPSAQKDLIYNMGKYFKDGVQIPTGDGKSVKVPVPAKLIVRAIQNSDENALANIVPGWSRRGDDTHNLVTEYLKDPNVLAEIAAGQAIQGRQELRNMVRGGLVANEGQFPSLEKKK